MEFVVKIARAIIVKGENILLCNNLVAGHYFLPGGHVEVGETPEITLKREMVEELGFEPTEIKFLLDFPNTYTKNGIVFDEVATIFLAKINRDEVTSREKQIAFEWMPINNLSTINFKPKQSAGDIMMSIEENKDFWI
jgi:8-oxo-dGTP pyrophosphatase MutT (NUDIX family)